VLTNSVVYSLNYVYDAAKVYVEISDPSQPIYRRLFTANLPRKMFFISLIIAGGTLVRH